MTEKLTEIGPIFDEDYETFHEYLARLDGRQLDDEDHRIIAWQRERCPRRVIDNETMLHIYNNALLALLGKTPPKAEFDWDHFCRASMPKQDKNLDQRETLAGYRQLSDSQKRKD